MNKFSNLTNEPGLATDNYIQEDMGQRKRTEDWDSGLRFQG